jgi:hypothetical protein
LAKSCVFPLLSPTKAISYLSLTISKPSRFNPFAQNYSKRRAPQSNPNKAHQPLNYQLHSWLHSSAEIARSTRIHELHELLLIHYREQSQPGVASHPQAPNLRPQATSAVPSSPLLYVLLPSPPPHSAPASTAGPHRRDLRRILESASIWPGRAQELLLRPSICRPCQREESHLRLEEERAGDAPRPDARRRVT